MQNKFIRMSLVLIAFMVVLAIAIPLGAQTGSDQAKSQTVTGCLQKGQESGGYYIIGANDKHWELYDSANASLADHVGHTVTVTGTVAHRSQEQEQKSQTSEKQETGSRQHSDLQVTSVKMVSADCKK